MLRWLHGRERGVSALIIPTRTTPIATQQSRRSPTTAVTAPHLLVALLVVPPHAKIPKNRQFTFSVLLGTPSHFISTIQKRSRRERAKRSTKDAPALSQVPKHDKIPQAVPSKKRTTADRFGTSDRKTQYAKALLLRFWPEQERRNEAKPTSTQVVASDPRTQTSLAPRANDIHLKRNNAYYEKILLALSLAR